MTSSPSFTVASIAAIMHAAQARLCGAELVHDIAEPLCLLNRRERRPRGRRRRRRRRRVEPAWEADHLRHRRAAAVPAGYDARRRPVDDLTGAGVEVGT